MELSDEELAEMNALIISIRTGISYNELMAMPADAFANLVFAYNKLNEEQRNGRS